MNLTISVDDDLLERAREAARKQGTSVQEYLRDCLRGLTGDRPREEVADELLDLMQRRGGHSGGARFRREDLYRDRVG